MNSLGKTAAAAGWPFGQKGAVGQLLWPREIDEKWASRPEPGSTRTAHEGHERVVLIATNYMKRVPGVPSSPLNSAFVCGADSRPYGAGAPKMYLFWAVLELITSWPKCDQRTADDQWWLLGIRRIFKGLLSQK